MPNESRATETFFFLQRQEPISKLINKNHFYVPITIHVNSRIQFQATHPHSSTTSASVVVPLLPRQWLHTYKHSTTSASLVSNYQQTHPQKHQPLLPTIWQQQKNPQESTISHITILILKFTTPKSKNKFSFLNALKLHFPSKILYFSAIKGDVYLLKAHLNPLSFTATAIYAVFEFAQSHTEYSNTCVWALLWYAWYILVGRQHIYCGISCWELPTNVIQQRYLSTLCCW